MREQAGVAAARMRATRRLYEFTRRLSSLATLDAVAEGAASEIHVSLGRGVLVLLAQDGELTLTRGVAAGRYARRRGDDGGALGLRPRRAGRRRYRHLADRAVVFHARCRSERKTLGVIGVAREAGTPPLDSEARALLDTLSEQAAAALDRAMLSREMVSARTATETERMRNMLLASISHDFRTPLSSILGAATSLLSFGDKLDPAAKSDLLGQIKQETEGLDEMVRNLLAITRIDAGALELRLDWLDLREIVDRIVSAARRRGAAQRIEVRLADDIPLIRADATLVEQAINNVICKRGAAYAARQHDSHRRSC